MCRTSIPLTNHKQGFEAKTILEAAGNQAWDSYRGGSSNKLSWEETASTFSAGAEVEGTES